MERFIPVEERFWKKGYTFRGIAFLPLFTRSTGSVPFVWIIRDRLPLEIKEQFTGVL